MRYLILALVLTACGTESKVNPDAMVDVSLGHSNASAKAIEVLANLPHKAVVVEESKGSEVAMNEVAAVAVAEAITLNVEFEEPKTFVTMDAPAEAVETIVEETASPIAPVRKALRCSFTLNGLSNVGDVTFDAQGAPTLRLYLNALYGAEARYFLQGAADYTIPMSTRMFNRYAGTADAQLYIKFIDGDKPKVKTLQIGSDGVKSLASFVDMPCS